MAEGATCYSLHTAETRVAAVVACTVTSWRERLRQLALQVSAAESAAHRDLQNPRTLSPMEREALQRASQAGVDERKAWEKDLWADVARLHKQVCALGSSMALAMTKGQMEFLVRQAEQRLHHAVGRLQQQGDELAALESSLTDSLQVALDRFEQWELQGEKGAAALHIARTGHGATNAAGGRQRSSSMPCSTSSSGAAVCSDVTKTDSQQLREQIDKLNAQLQNNGSRDGWAQDDHDTFVRVLTRLGRRVGNKFLAEVQLVLPHIDHSKLIAHAKWFASYEECIAKRSLLLKQWRALSLSRPSGGRTDAAIICCSSVPEALEEADAERIQQASERLQRQQEHSHKRQLVAEWQQAKREAAQSRAEQDRLEQRAALESEERQRQQKKEACSKALEEFRRQREHEKATLQGAPSIDACNLSQEDRSRIAQRNIQFTETRHLQLQTRREQQLHFAPQSRVQQTRYAHVESRLHSHTEAFIERARDLGSQLHAKHAAGQGSGGVYRGNVAGNFAHQALVRTTRSCPAWRQRFGV